MGRRTRKEIGMEMRARLLGSWTGRRRGTRGRRTGGRNCNGSRYETNKMRLTEDSDVYFAVLYILPNDRQSREGPGEWEH